MKRTRTLIVPFIASLAAGPISGCGDASESPSPSAGDQGDAQDGVSTTGDANPTNDANDSDEPEGSPGGTGGGSQPDDGTTSKPDDNPGGGGTIDCSKLQTTGIKVGEVPGNVTLLNAKGEEVSLHDYCNDIIYVMAGSAF